MTNFIDGIDVSQYQGNINWVKVEPQVEFAYIRGTICLPGYARNDYKDYLFEDNWRAARKTKLKLGMYHVMTYFGVGTQIETILKALADKKVDLPIALDVERDDWQSPRAAANAVEELANALINVYGFEVIIYTGAWYWNVKVEARDWTKYPLWVASYTNRPIMPRNWTEWNVWQYSSTGRVDGIQGNVDLNYADHNFLPEPDGVTVTLNEETVLKSGLGLDALTTGTMKAGEQVTIKKAWVEMSPGSWVRLDHNFS